MKQNVTIGPATEEEREWTASLMARSEPWLTLGASLEICRESCRDPEYLLYVARDEGRPRGAILLQRRGLASSPYVKSIVVDPEHRSEGIGAALMEFAENLFRGESRHLFLCVSSFNRGARSFYERQGYSKVGELEDYVIEGASEILMHKRLR
ncbi:MAG TPA: GNAT family N-acetyltransferase [Vicinamibacteria bacterium]